jgi:hypothetical protein
MRAVFSLRSVSRRYLTILPRVCPSCSTVDVALSLIVGIR